METRIFILSWLNIEQILLELLNNLRFYFASSAILLGLIRIYLYLCSISFRQIGFSSIKIPIRITLLSRISLMDLIKLILFFQLQIRRLAFRSSLLFFWFNCLVKNLFTFTFIIVFLRTQSWSIICDNNFCFVLGNLHLILSN
jgi:hypothetical protein